VIACGKRLLGGRAAPVCPDGAAGLRDRDLFAIYGVVAVLLFLCNSQVVVLMAMCEYWRYIDPAALLLPGLPMLGVYVLGKYVLRRRARSTVNRAAMTGVPCFARSL
jgi:hypothetical protein